MPSVANFPSAVRLAAGHAVGLPLLAADGDGLLELAAVGAGRGGAFAGRRHAAAVAGVGVAPGDRLADRRGGCALVGALRLLAVDRVHGAADLAANEGAEQGAGGEATPWDCRSWRPRGTVCWNSRE